MNRMSGSRAHWIDNLKALGICLVVVGHSSVPDQARQWLRSFNMPMFLMISGFLISPGGFDVKLKEFFVRRMWPFIKLYFGFSLLGLVSYLFVFKGLEPFGAMLRERLLAILYASGSFDSSRDVYPIVLWYFPCSILGRLVAYLVWQIPGMITKVLVFAGVGIFALGFKGQALPWEFESALPAAGFLALGHMARISGIDSKIQRLGSWHLPLAIAFTAIGSLCALKNINYPDLRTLALGNPFLAIPATLLLSMGVTMLAMKCCPSRLALVVASATVFIFPVHLLLFPYIDRGLSQIGFIEGDLGGYGIVKALLAVGILGLLHFIYSVVRSNTQITVGPHCLNASFRRRLLLREGVASHGIVRW